MQAIPVRFIRVAGVRQLTPHLVRVTFGGADLADLYYDEPDQQVKLYFPKPGQSVPRMPAPSDDFTGWYDAFNAIPEPERPWMRSYTIRTHDPEHQTIAVDFVVHDDHAGPATRWARTAGRGDTLAMVGPSAYFTRPIPLRTSIAAADWLLLVGDETALPAIGGILEALPDGSRAEVFVEVPGLADEQAISTRGMVDLHWLHRDGVPPGQSTLLLDAVRRASFPTGAIFAWLAGEAGIVRSLRRHLVDERGVDKRAIEFTGHWRRALSQDDPPSADDLAEAQERLAMAAAAPSSPADRE